LAWALRILIANGAIDSAHSPIIAQHQTSTEVEDDPMNDPRLELRCLHCSVILPPHEISDGWCDSCGKRLPTSLYTASHTATPIDNPRDPESVKLWGVICSVAGFSLVSMAVLFFLATAG